MASQQPLYLAQGKGRGRGRGKRGQQNNGQPQQATLGAWTSAPPGVYQGGNNGPGAKRNLGKQPQPPVNSSWNKGLPLQPSSQQNRMNRGQNRQNNTMVPKSAEERFKEASKPLKDSVLHHIEAAGDDGDDDYETSSDEDDMDDEQIMTSTYEAYAGQINDGVSVDESKQFLKDAWLSGASGCLVCLGKVKRLDAIWSCSECYCVLHLVCIQKWAKQCTMMQDLNAGEQNVSASKAMWQCPKCRTDYKMSACPSRYMCFCLKEKDPSPQLWLAPHTCGQTCERLLRPHCGHKCLLLCHPGPCPPCPKMIKSPCYCGQSTPQARRCSTKEWTCGQTCRKTLACGQHQCQSKCHSGDCPPCTSTSQQDCLCGKDQQIRPCDSPKWTCGKVCGKVLPCGNHVCEEECHGGTCGECPRAGKRSCPCGKTKFDLPCTEDIPNCGDTCEKLLECGVHKCSQRCHSGTCETCRQMRTKQCRCGIRNKSVPCYKEYLCDSKCNKQRDCTRHQCKRKCCDGSCPPCEQNCGRQLTCKNHKCPSRCHPGMCYPCPELVDLKCACGSTVITVPCGREKVTKPPKCSKKCTTPPDCHHPKRDPHRCHFGRCPPCRQICDKAHKICPHTCPQMCHSAVLVKQVENKPAPAGPWEAKPRAMLTVVNFPCPPCQVPIPTQCLGKHEVTDLACSAVASFSCGRPCGRWLSCGNHGCELVCHAIKSTEDKDGQECAQCEEGCKKSRPKGCTHACLLPCHPDPCPPCTQGIKVRCHCQMMLLFKECSIWTRAGEHERLQLISCGGLCPKQLDCGHQCSKICHDDECSLAGDCRHKKAVRCGCRRRKKDFLCKEVTSGSVKLDCDEACKQAKDKKEKHKEDERKKQEDEEKKKQKRDQEEYDRLMGKGKKRRNRKRSQTKELTFYEKNKTTIIALSALGFVFISAMLFYFLKA